MSKHMFERVQEKAASEYHRKMQEWQEAIKAGDIERAAKINLGHGSIQEIKDRESEHADDIIRAALAEFAGGRNMDASTFHTLTVFVGRVYGPRALWTLDHFNALAPDAYADIVTYVWSAAEFPGLALKKQDWIRLFKKSGFTINGEDAERPTHDLTLYRGARPSHKRGLAWTADIKVAKWFVTGRYGSNRLYQVTVPPDRLLAYIHEDGRSEDEWITDVRSLPLKELE